MLSQLIANGIIAGSVYTLIALGFALIYNTTRFFHFAHGAVYALGAYLVYVFAVKLGLPLLIASGLSIALAMLTGCSMELFIYKPLRKQKSSALVLLLSSLGMFISIQNIVTLIFGNETKTLRGGVVHDGYRIINISITPIQVLILAVSLFLTFLLYIFLSKTRTGKAMRAISDDPEMSEITGIDTDRVILTTFAIGSILAAVAGILVALDIDIWPTMGMNAVLMGAVAVIVGGIGKIQGAVLGGFLLGLVQHLGIWQIPSKWQDCIALSLLLLFILFRPRGILGESFQREKI